MMQLKYLIKRNIKLFFMDKGMFFTSLATPIILLVLYITFLGNVYKDTILSIIPSDISISERVVDGFVACQLFSSLLAVSCITVAFCSNLLMVNDKVTGAINDITITPVKNSTLVASYAIATAVSTLIVSYIAVSLSFIYIAIVGWYIPFIDVLLILLDVFLLVLFGTGLSTVINMFLSSQGQMSAVGTIVSSGYGFICGAYMPISQFSEGLQNILSFLPGTYGMSLLRNHSLSGPLNAMKGAGLPDELVDILKDTVDCNIYMFGEPVPILTMYLIILISIFIISLLFLILYKFNNKRI